MAAKKGVTKFCDKCQQAVGVYAFKRHYALCGTWNPKARYSVGSDHPGYPDPVPHPDGLACPSCGEVWSTLARYKLHYKKHLGRHKSPAGWNRGLTSQTDERVRLGSAKSLGAIERWRNQLTPEAYASWKESVISGSRASTTSGGCRRGAGRGKSGIYSGYDFDSTWELAWIMFNLDHRIPFERNREGFTYTYMGKARRYYPDFKQGEIFVEIKGYWTPQVEHKLAAVDRPIVVLTKREIQPFLTYAIQTYGPEFWGPHLYNTSGNIAETV